MKRFALSEVDAGPMKSYYCTTELLLKSEINGLTKHLGYTHASISESVAWKFQTVTLNMTVIG